MQFSADAAKISTEIAESRQGRNTREGACKKMRSMVIEGLYFVIEPVCSLEYSREVLYRECLARIAAGGGTLYPRDFLPQLRLLGLSRWFDAVVVARVLRMLSSAPELVLACNVAADSAVDDGVWEVVFAQLEAFPEAASRLVVEVTENEPIDPEHGCAFVRKLRQFGCRIAVDDLGVLYGVQTALAIGDPDVVKVDGSFVRAARKSAGGVARLQGILALAAQMAGQVVVEGVETKGDLDLVRKCGAKWGQGYLLSAVHDIYSRGGDGSTALMSCGLLDNSAAGLVKLPT